MADLYEDTIKLKADIEAVVDFLIAERRTTHAKTVERLIALVDLQNEALQATTTLAEKAVANQSNPASSQALIMMDIMRDALDWYADQNHWLAPNSNEPGWHVAGEGSMESQAARPGDIVKLAGAVWPTFSPDRGARARIALSAVKTLPAADTQEPVQLLAAGAADAKLLEDLKAWWTAEGELPPILLARALAEYVNAKLLIFGQNFGDAIELKGGFRP